MLGPFLLVGNPSSQSGRAAGRIADALAAMEARGWDVTFLETQPAGRTPGLVSDATRARPWRAVIYLGGDGTFGEVAQGLLASGTDVPLGMLPAGTANDQGKSFGVRSAPGALEENLDILAAGFVRRIDVGWVERLDKDGVIDASAWVFHSLGFGLQPDVLAQRNRDRAFVGQLPLLGEIYRDQAVYAGAVLQRTLASIVEPTKFDAIAEADGERLLLTGLTDVVVNATPVYGGAWVLDPEAEPDDGLFEMVPVFGRRDWARSALQQLQPLVVVNQFVGVLSSIGEVHRRHVSELELWLERPGREDIPSQVDGEEWVSGRHFRLTVRRQRLPVVVPEAWTPPWRRGATP